MKLYAASVERRFWKYTQKKNSNQCWPWIGSCALRGNYGQLNDRGKILKAHRVSFELHFGKVPKEKFICHSCGNAQCVNPKHLYAGTPAENWADTLKHGTRFVPNGAKGEKHHSAKLKEKQIFEIRKSSLSCQELGEIYGVTRQTIYNIKKYKIWKKVKGRVSELAARKAKKLQLRN